MNKEFISSDTIRDAGLKLAHKMYVEDGFVPDIIYVSLRGGAYMGNVISEYYKMVRKRTGGRPVFYAAVVARSYSDVRAQSKIMVDGWTYSPNHLRAGDRILIVDDIFDTGNTVNELTSLIMEHGIPREDIKVAVFDYKVPMYKTQDPLPIQPDYWCRRHVMNHESEEAWIHYMCHEMVGLTSEEIDEQYTDPEVRAILHEVRGDK